MSPSDRDRALVHLRRWNSACNASLANWSPVAVARACGAADVI